MFEDEGNAGGEWSSESMSNSDVDDVVDALYACDCE